MKITPTIPTSINRALIVGGAGYIGGHLTDTLWAEGYDVTVFDNLLYETRYTKPVHFIKGDVKDKDLLTTLLPNYEYVIWLAAVVGDGACSADGDEAKIVNEDSVKWLVDNYDGKIIFTSTCSVYGANDNLISEEDTPNPLSIYAKTKLEAEQYIIENHKNYYLIFRLGTLYGLGDIMSRIRLDLVVNILTCKAAMGESLSVFGGEQWRPLLHVKDVALATAYCMKNKTSGLYNLSSGNYKIHEIADEIKNTLEDVEVEYEEQAYEDQRNYKVQNQKITSTGWAPKHTLSEGINEIAKTIKENRIVDVTDPVYSNEAYLTTK
tara:strand:+ start:1400 stop:2365 length:966 start_codon:yes stop_codon:yes gene_type:complete